MSEIREKIKEINKTAKKSRRINNVLWVCVIGLVGLAFYFAYLASEAKSEALVQREVAENRAIENDSLRREAVESKQKILDVIKEADADLWEQAKTANTVQSYSFYLKVTEGKQRNDEIKSAIDLLFRDEGYVQLLDSNGSTKYFKEQIKSDMGHFFIALDDRNVNTGVLRHSDFPGARNKRRHSIKKGQVVKMLEEFQHGSAIWAKIGYKNR